uniref:Uncharacterized protein n=1 Tax=viral metagenome TaxID=1070528 RepID=A0A6C0ETH8_9ZZZZ
MKTERSMNNFESRKQIIETIREKQELKRKEILRLIKNGLFEKYNNECLVHNNIELKRTIILNKINEANKYFKIIEEMNNIDIIIKN